MKAFYQGDRTAIFCCTFYFFFLRAYGHFLPLQDTPSPEYPSLQEQLKEPRVLLQVARE